MHPGCALREDQHARGELFAAGTTASAHEENALPAGSDSLLRHPVHGGPGQLHLPPDVPESAPNAAHGRRRALGQSSAAQSIDDILCPDLQCLQEGAGLPDQLGSHGRER